MTGPIPIQIGRYRVTSVLGRGAMGVVYRGVDPTLDREVAVKVMSGGSGADADARARFKREAQAAARLQHPNIVTIYELGEHEGAPYMVLELLGGVDLQQAIEAGIRPDPKISLPVVLQTLAGLGHAHDHGIVHRDVKPSNIFLPAGRPAKIMDFGVARLGQGMTSTGLVVGTPNYMSPEQVRAGPVDGRSDLFSAGLILYELVTGEKAFRGDSLMALLYKIAHEDPDLSLIPEGGGWSRLRAVLVRSLARDPDERYFDADAMRADLAEALLELGGSPQWDTATDLGRRGLRASPGVDVTLGAATPPPTAPIAPTTVIRPEPLIRAEGRARPVNGSRRSPSILVGGLALGAMALLGLMLTMHRRAPPTASPAETSVSPTHAPISVAPAPTTAPAAIVPAPATSPSAAPKMPPPATTPAATREPPSASASVDKANNDLENRRYAQALAEARAVLGREPTNAEARTIAEEAEAGLVIEEALVRAKEALKKGNKEEAKEALKKGLAVNGNEARLLALWREATQ
ncbi:MAG: protein kinase [Vicinamibacteria bacterium]